MEIDLLFLCRDASPPRPDVRRGIEAQAGVRLNVHRVIGTPRPSDANRWETIARARNQGKRLGSSPWVMYLDDDVVLRPGCVARLVEGLRRKPEFAALAADSSGEMGREWANWDYPPHVGMAATLFRRERLAGLTFRWEPGKCECWCCCEDLRRSRFGIGYLPGASARHEPSYARGREPAAHGGQADQIQDASKPTIATGHILAAFNRRDFRSFRRQFLGSLRASGNREPVAAFAYGLFPSERSLLATVPGVEVVPMTDNGDCPAVRRLRDFQETLSRLPEDAPVAYWDAGDVVFQSRLGPLWEQVRANPDVLLVAREPLGYPENGVIRSWTSYIRDPIARRRAFELTSTNPFFNSGFAAGSAGALLRYLREGDRLLHSSALHGVGAWGDQLALNVFCHTNPDAWKEIPTAWNYCLAGRPTRDYRLRPGGRFEASSGEPIVVVHGNAGLLRGVESTFLPRGLR